MHFARLNIEVLICWNIDILELLIRFLMHYVLIVVKAVRHSASLLY